MNFIKIEEIFIFFEEKIYIKYVVIFFLVLMYAYTISDPIFKFYEIAGYDDTFANFDFFKILSSLLFAPIIEEFFFRGYLSGKRNHFLFILPQILISFIVLEGYFIWVFSCSVIPLLLYYFDRSNSEKEISNSVLYVSALFTSVIFSVIHYKNFSSGSLNFDLVLSLMAFFPGALFLVYVRYNGGLFQSILGHIALNFFTLSINTLIY